VDQLRTAHPGNRRFAAETKVRLTGQQLARLDEFSVRRGTTRSQEIRQAIVRYLAAFETPELADALDALSTFDAEGQWAQQDER
jgi:predicted DNA-binding protein